MKIFSTQLQGYFTKIAEQEELNVEDGARLLAQACISEGTIYIYGSREMQGIAFEALYGEEPLPGAHILQPENLADITTADRILIISRFSTDADAIKLAKELQQQGHAIIGISAKKEGKQSLETYTDFHIDTKLVKGLIPSEDGTRYGFPSIMVALFAYYLLHFTIKDILDEYKIEE